MGQSGGGAVCEECVGKGWVWEGGSVGVLGAFADCGVCGDNWDGRVGWDGYWGCEEGNGGGGEEESGGGGGEEGGEVFIEVRG